MAKRYVCEGCNKGCKYGVLHPWEQTCRDCMLSPPCISAGPRILCDLCNRHCRSQTCYDNDKKKTLGKRRKSTCDLHKCCGTCALFTHKKHECNRRFCVTCNEKKQVAHLCFMRPLGNAPASSERVLYIFYDFETTQDSRRSDVPNEHVPKLVCLQKFCCKCENIRYRTGLHSVWKAHTLVLGRSSVRYVQLFVQIPTLGKKHSRDSS